MDIGCCVNMLPKEPNNRTETNMLNTFFDVVALAKAVNHPNVRCLQDYYHLKWIMIL